MPRSRNNVAAKNRKKKIFKLAKGYFGRRKNVWTVTKNAVEKALQYSSEREAFGKPIHKFQSVSFKIADMATEIEASKLLVYHAAWMKDQGISVVKEAAMAKLFASEVAMKTTTEAIQVHGGYGYVKEFDVERFFRDAKILEIGEGTSEIQRIVIAREILNSFQSA